MARSHGSWPLWYGDVCDIVAGIYNSFHDMSVLGSHDLTDRALRILQSVGQPGWSRPTVIAETTRTSAATISHLLADLEKQGLIARHTNSADRRQWILELTEQGAAVFDAMVAEQTAALAPVVARWSAVDLAHSSTLLTRLARDLSREVSNQNPH